MAGSSQDTLGAFVEELAQVRALCGSPSLKELVAHSADLPHPLARSTISDKLNARSLPDWDFVASFVTACRAHAEAAGMTPSSDVVDLARWDDRHLRLLRELEPVRGDERLAAAAGTARQARAAAIAPPMPRQLPAAVRHFAGRTAQLQLLSRLAEESTESGTTVIISAIHGTAGVGKTALAVHAAHLLADRFPDGQLYVNLRGFDPGGQIVSTAEAVRGFLEALSVPPEQIPASPAAQVNLYRSRLADRRVLVLLDNARDAEQVRPLVPGTPGSLVLVTSRDRLTSLVARDGACPIPVDLLTDAEARELLAGRLGGRRVQHEAEAVTEIISRCARLPLALSVVAARALARPADPLALLVHGLRAAPNALDMLGTADPATGIRPLLSWSYGLLSGGTARLFRMLALHPGPDVSPAAAASLAGVAERQARAALDELADAHLIEEQRPARFGFHDLLRAYAAELAERLDSAAARRAAVGRMLDHYLHSGHRAAVRLDPVRRPLTLGPTESGVTLDDPTDQAAAQAWLADERRVLLELVELAANEGFDVHSWQLTWALTDFLHRHGHWQDWARSQETAVAAARRLGDRHALAHMYRNLGLVHGRLEHHDEAVRYCRLSLALHRELGDLIGWAHAHLNLGGIALTLADRATANAERRSRQRTALRHASRAADLLQAAGDQASQAQALNNMGWVYTQLGDHRRAIVVCEHALAVLNETRARPAQAATCNSLGYAYHHLGDYAEALVRYQHALELYVELGDRKGEAETLISFGDTQVSAGDPEAARAAWDRALAILTDIDNPSADLLRARLAALTKTTPVG